MTGYEMSPLAMKRWADEGLRIRNEIPVRGTTATEEEVIRRDEATVEALRAANLPAYRLGETGTTNTWYTVLADDETAAGCWAHSAAEAILDTALWRGKRAAQVYVDPNGSYLRELRAGRDSMQLALF